MKTAPAEEPTKTTTATNTKAITKGDDKKAHKTKDKHKKNTITKDTTMKGTKTKDRHTDEHSGSQSRRSQRLQGKKTRQDTAGLEHAARGSATESCVVASRSLAIGQTDDNDQHPQTGSQKSTIEVSDTRILNDTACRMRPQETKLEQMARL